MPPHLLQLADVGVGGLFQRRDAWDTKRKSRFIESIVLGLPIPQIVLAEAKDDKGSFLVINGKQRLLSLHQFAGLDSSTTPLALTGLKGVSMVAEPSIVLEVFISLRVGTFSLN